MKAFITITFLCTLLNLNLCAQPIKPDSALIKEIGNMFKDDQFWRKEYIKVNKKEKSDYDQETIEKGWKTSDSINELKAKVIINKYGYPGYDLVGEISDDFWAIIQHCDDDVPFQEHVLSLMKIQIAKSNASKEKYAYLADRILVNKNQKQIYGTQLQRDKTGKFYPFPLKYPKEVNKLRKKVGLGPLEEYVKSFGL
ncbi:MAG: hypothetical protein JWQ63_3598 [Mucilaginibacter sp.]|jgi:hypothetical protein|nr:hypothetical protein [Mucilaginibacter sp.]